MGAGPALDRAIDRSRTVEELVRRRFDDHRAELVGRSPALGADPADEDVHQARVAVRRLRSDLRLFAPFFRPSHVATLRPELEWISAVLGHVRDLDVLGQTLTARAPKRWPLDTLEPILAPIALERAAALDELCVATTSERFSHLLIALGAFASEPPLRSDHDVNARHAMPKLIRRSWKQLHRAARSLGPDERPEELHRVRILTKRARYAVEAVDGFSFARSGALARRLTNLQDHLGSLNDHVVAGAWLTRSGPTLDDSLAVFRAGELCAAVYDEADHLARSWREPWARVDRSSLRRWF